MPRLSVFTSLHRPRYTDMRFEGLRRHGCRDEERIVLLNGGAAWCPVNPDRRVRLMMAEGSWAGLFALKQPVTHNGGQVSP
jgi:hypothetical protein